MVYYASGDTMIIKLKTNELEKFAAELEDLRAALYPGEPECNGGFYMFSPNELYIDEEIGGVALGQLEKMCVKYEHSDEIKQKLCVFD